MRQQYERKHNVRFTWVVNARPDNVYINTLPDLRRLGSGSDVVYVPSWGHGYDPTAAGRSLKRRPGINDRFAFGSADAMGAYHDLYARFCHRGMSGDMPKGLNFEQMMHWYLVHEGVKTAHIPGEFWFFRLRTGAGTMPVEHPGHRPAMVGRCSLTPG